MQRIVFTLVSLAFVSTAAWTGDIQTDGKLISTEPTEPPLEVASSAKVSNLNADRLDGFHVDDFAAASSGVGVHYENLVGLPGGEIDPKAGIICVNCMALDNTIYSNGEFGIDFGDSTSDSAYGRNWIQDNTDGAVTGSGYTDLGQNVCDGAACP